MPKIIEVKSSYSDIVCSATNIQNRALSSKMATKFGDRFCEQHPDYNNEMLVDFQTEGNIMIIMSYCCDTFKENLTVLAEGKNPFKNKI